MTRPNLRRAESALGVIAMYAFVAWVYVALCALVAPQILHLPLVQLFAGCVKVNRPHEDTFGFMCFGLSFFVRAGLATVASATHLGDPKSAHMSGRYLTMGRRPCVS
jgi:hypothetical protein